MNLPLPAPATLDASPDAWIKKNEIVGRNLITLQPTDITTYYGATEAGTDLFLTSSVILSATNKGLPIASFAVGSQLSHRAGYFGFEPYETAGTAGSAAYCTDANWNCAGGEVASFTTSNVQPHAGSQSSYWSRSGGITVSPVTFMPAIDIYGQPLDTVVSAWVAPAASQTARSVSRTPAAIPSSIRASPATALPRTTSKASSGLDDVGTSAPLPPARRRAIDTSASRACRQDSAPRSTIPMPTTAPCRAWPTTATPPAPSMMIATTSSPGYVERLSADHAVSSRMTSGAMAAGFSRFARSIFSTPARARLPA